MQMAFFCSQLEFVGLFFRNSRHLVRFYGQRLKYEGAWSWNNFETDNNRSGLIVTISNFYEEGCFSSIKEKKMYSQIAADADADAVPYGMHAGDKIAS